MTDEQIEKAKRLAGKISREEIAERLGVSVPTLKRKCKGVSFTQKKLFPFKTDKKLREKIIADYLRLGRKETQKKYPEVKVRSCIEKYLLGQKPKQTPWSHRERLQLLQLAGLLSAEKQAKLISRKGLTSSSIKSAFIKQFGIPQQSINGMKKHTVKQFLKNSCPYTLTQRLYTSKDSTRKTQPGLYLYIDMEEHLKEEAPEFFKESIYALAKFQRWVFAAKDNKECRERITHFLTI